VSLFENLYYAGRSLEDKYWWAVFQNLAGRPGRDADQDADRVLEAIRNALSAGGPLDDAATSRLEDLAEEVAKKLRPSEPRPRCMSHEQLRSLHASLKAKAAKRGGKDLEWARHSDFQFHKDYELPNLVVSSVLLQGIELRCPRCATVLFYGVHELGNMVPCRGCLVSFPCDVFPEWKLRLNELLGSAIRDRGTIPEIRTLADIQTACHSGMMLYLPCLDVIRRDKSRLTDLDVVAVAERQFIIGEVKTKPADFRTEDFEHLRIVAEKTVPDMVVVAALGDSWPHHVLSDIENLTDKLKVIGVPVYRHQIGEYFQGLR
jgi:hypothetical protein